MKIYTQTHFWKTGKRRTEQLKNSRLENKALPVKQFQHLF